MGGKQMKVALVHDYLKEYGGAERVLESLHELYPDAPVYTLIYAPQFLGPHKERFSSWNIKSSFLKYLPFSYKLLSIFRLIAPLVFKTFDFSGYEVVIVSATGAYSPNMINKKNARQICYCHTPPRYLYGFATARDWKKNPVFRILGELANHLLRMVDYQSSKHVDLFIANSENIKKRIEKFYRRDAVVVYPPATMQGSGSRVDVLGKKTSTHNLKPKTYYLTGGRLARGKHVDLIVSAFAELGLPLKVFGKGFAGYDKELRSISNFQFQISNIQFLGEVTDDEKLHLMQQAKAFIIAAEDEDFGIVPVEAMSMGTPVIAYRSGGLQESVIEGKTGIFFDELTVESLKRAIKKFEKLKFDPKDGIKQAEKFSGKKFKQAIQSIVNSPKSRY